MALIHHLTLGVERNVGERAVPIWTKQPRPGWLPGPLPVEPERTADAVLVEISEAAARNPIFND